MPVFSDETTRLFSLDRRSFIYRAAAGAGAVLLWTVFFSCAGTPSTQDRDSLKEIKAIREKEPNDPVDVQRLKDILLPWSGEPSNEVKLEAARALALHADFFVIPTYVEAVLKNSNNETFLNNLMQLLAVNYVINPPARLKIIYFLYRFSDPSPRRIQARNSYLAPDSVIEQARSSFRFLGNIAYRNYLIKLNEALTEVHWSISRTAYQQELQRLIGELYPSFLNVRLEEIRVERYPDEKLIASWRAQLSSGSDEDKINALRNLHRVSFQDAELLLGMLENASLELQRAIVAILGNNGAFSPEIQTVMLKYLDCNDDQLVIASAKALRFKEQLPAEEIVKILERHRKQNPVLRQQIDDILLSTLVSEDAALADIFKAMTGNMFNNEPNNKKDKLYRINEMRAWYWRLGNPRKDHPGYPYGKSDDMDSLVYRSNNTNYERNNRNDRVRLAMPSVPYDIQDLFIAFLRQIPAIAGPKEKHYEDKLSRDLKDLQEIHEVLSSRGILLLSEANDTIRKSLTPSA